MAGTARPVIKNTKTFMSDTAVRQGWIGEVHLQVLQVNICIFHLVETFKDICTSFPGILTSPVKVPGPT